MKTAVRVVFADQVDLVREVEQLQHYRRHVEAICRHLRIQYLLGCHVVVISRKQLKIRMGRA